MSGRLSIVVMLGGPGAERDVSLKSGTAVANALRSLGHAVSEIDPKDGTFELPASTEVVFLALHGTFGEDGQVQQGLEELGVPYTGCGVEASRIAFDKVLTKSKCVGAGVPTPRHEVISSTDAAFPPGWNGPCVLKPVRQGSSVGLRFVRSPDDWKDAVQETLRHDSRALLEEVIVGTECTVGILAGNALPIVEVRPREGVYDYTTKYTAGSTEYLCPAPFKPGLTTAVQEAGLRAFAAVGGRDYGRVDVMVDGEGKPFVLEVNTLPGMTETSLFPKAAAAAGISYEELCQRMIDLALRRRPGERGRSPVPNEDDAVAH